MILSDFLKQSVSDNKEEITDLLVSNDQIFIDSVKELYAIEQFQQPLVRASFNVNTIDEFSNVKLTRLVVDMRGNNNITHDLKILMDRLDITIQLFAISDVDSVRLEQQIQSLGCHYILWDSSLNGLLSAIKSQSNGAFGGLSVRKAKRVLILGTKGGVGVTSISTSLVNAMSVQANLKTLLVEHDFSAVNSDIYLGVTDLKLKSNTIDVNEIDKTIAKTYVANVSEQLSYIALQNKTTSNVHFSTLYNISSNLKEEYSFIVDSVSLSFFDNLITDSFIKNYDRVYVVCEPSISSLRSYNYLKRNFGKFNHSVIFNMTRPSKDYVMSLSNAKTKIKAENTIDITYEPLLEKTIIQRGLNEISSFKFYKSIALIVNQLSGKEIKAKTSLFSFMK
ncbi:AAA family ATPase [Vibrio parahaemolyticus]|uniref:AAA family ATPase n=1 Tax=Vibrio parahaemolyticus TaxID=670 RepID=UPI001EEA2209|nr:AAA family ATPase [Vibrio parahaemolyticus]MCG6461801.1 AAA family ATPase [Vibrio parahaemolyticus]